MRLFVAVQPPVDVLDHLDLALAAARRSAGADGAVRWSARDTWHLTCAFYGEVAEGAVDDLVRTLTAALSPRRSYRLALRGAGVFAHRTLWVGVGGDVDAQRSVAQAATDAGLVVAARPDRRARVRAHLTVGRARPGRAPARRRGSRPGPHADVDPADALVRALAVYEGPAWTVRQVLLEQSRPGEGRGGGPLYIPLAAIPLIGEEPPH